MGGIEFYQAIRQNPRWTPIPFILPYILYHHERWDGTGYPHKIGGKEIPVEGRLLAVADVYNALATEQPYHPARMRSSSSSCKTTSAHNSTRRWCRYLSRRWRRNSPGRL